MSYKDRIESFQRQSQVCGIMLQNISECPDYEAILASAIFNKWFSNLDRGLILRKVTIQSVDIIHGRVKFIKMLVESSDITVCGYKDYTSVVFLRGDSVAILPVIRCEGRHYTVLTTQVRVPAGALRFAEIPAGTLEDGDFSGTAIREMKEETGLDLNEFERIELSTQPLFLSPGACDEQMMFYAAIKDMTKTELASLQGRVTGLKKENEHIELQVIPFEQVPAVADAKTVLAWALYCRIMTWRDVAGFNL